MSRKISAAVLAALAVVVAVGACKGSKTEATAGGSSAAAPAKQPAGSNLAGAA